MRGFVSARLDAVGRCSFLVASVDLVGERTVEVDACQSFGAEVLARFSVAVLTVQGRTLLVVFSDQRLLVAHALLLTRRRLLLIRALFCGLRVDSYVTVCACDVIV